MKLISLLVLATFIATAADAPKLSDSQRAKFWRSQAEYISSLAQAQRAKEALDAAQKELTTACGEYVLSVGQDGEPTCAPKPEPKKDK